MSILVCLLLAKLLIFACFQQSCVTLPRRHYAATYDKLQIEQGLPQKYGTQRYGKGEKIDPLFEVANHPLDREQINKERATLGLRSLEQEEERIINPSREQRGLKPLPSKKSKEEEKTKEITMPKCSNCGSPGHTSISCIRPPPSTQKIIIFRWVLLYAHAQ